MKPKVVDVEYRLQALRNFNIHASVIDEYSRVDEVCLSLDLAASQTWQQAIRLNQTHTGLGQANAIPNPEGKLPTNEVWIIEDSVEPSGLVVRGTAVSLGPEKRSLEAEVI